MTMAPHLRIARPVTNVARAADMYCRGLGLQVLGSFDDHEGFDGVMVGVKGAGFHIEFTRSRGHPVAPAPTPEDLLVFYLPDLDEWQAACERTVAAGFRPIASFNPYWDRQGRTFEDADGYRVVLQRARWDDGR
jgi:catechol 2,3-dioxygenase-like lactoylglutathione lyase family enzyme